MDIILLLFRKLCACSLACRLVLLNLARCAAGLRAAWFILPSCTTSSNPPCGSVLVHIVVITCQYQRQHNQFRTQSAQHEYSSPFKADSYKSQSFGRPSVFFNPQSSINNLPIDFIEKFWKLKALHSCRFILHRNYNTTLLSSSQTTWLVLETSISEEDPSVMVPLPILWRLLPPLWSRW